MNRNTNRSSPTTAAPLSPSSKNDSSAAAGERIMQRTVVRRPPSKGLRTVVYGVADNSSSSTESAASVNPYTMNRSLASSDFRRALARFEGGDNRRTGRQSTGADVPKEYFAPQSAAAADLQLHGKAIRIATIQQQQSKVRQERERFEEAAARQKARVALDDEAVRQRQRRWRDRSAPALRDCKWRHSMPPEAFIAAQCDNVRRSDSAQRPPPAPTHPSPPTTLEIVKASPKGFTSSSSSLSAARIPRGTVVERLAKFQQQPTTTRSKPAIIETAPSCDTQSSFDSSSPPEPNLLSVPLPYTAAPDDDDDEPETTIVIEKLASQQQRQRSNSSLSDDLIMSDSGTGPPHSVSPNEQSGVNCRRARSSLSSASSGTDVVMMNDHHEPPSIAGVASRTCTRQELLRQVDAASTILSREEGKEQAADVDALYVACVERPDAQTGGGIGLVLTSTTALDDGDGEEFVSIHKVIMHSLAHRNGRIEAGDRLLVVNGHAIEHGMTHREALHILKQPSAEVVLVLARAHSQAVPTAGERPEVGTTTITVNAPTQAPVASTVKTVTLLNGPGGLGLSIEGGKQSALGDKPLTIRRIFYNSPAEKCQQLGVGDQLVSVGGVDARNLSRLETWNLLKSLPVDEPVELRVKPFL